MQLGINSTIELFVQKQPLFQAQFVSQKLYQMYALQFILHSISNQK